MTTTDTGKSPGTAGAALVAEISSWTEADLDRMIAAAIAPKGE